MPLRAHSPCEGKAPRAVESDRIGGLDVYICQFVNFTIFVNYTIFVNLQYLSILQRHCLQHCFKTQKHTKQNIDFKPKHKWLF